MKQVPRRALALNKVKAVVVQMLNVLRRMALPLVTRRNCCPKIKKFNA